MITSPDDNKSPFALMGGLALVLVAQLLWSMPRLDEPFIDGQSHVDYDNANFMRHAAHSVDTSIRDSRKLFGVTDYVYDNQGRPNGLDFYNHHGLFSPFLHGCLSYLFGANEATVRGFTLSLSLLTTIAIGLLLFIELQSATQAVLLCLLHAMMPLRLTYLDQWKYEVGVEFVAMFCLAALALTRQRWTPLRYAAFLASFGLLFHTDYAGYLIAACLWLWLLSVGFRSQSFACAIHAAISGAVGILTTLTIQYWLGFDLDEILRTFSSRTSGAMDGLTIRDVVARQLLHFDFNYGSACLFVMLSGMLYPLINRQVRFNLCAAASLIFFTVNLIWMLALRNHSHIHHYAQWWFGSACVFAIAGSSLEFRKVSPDVRHKLRPLILPATIVFYVIVGVTGFTSSQSFHLPSFGTVNDIEVIRSLDSPIVVLNDGNSGPVEWWSGPVIRTYTDPIVAGPNKGVSFTDSPSDAILRGKFLVLLNSPGVVQGFLGVHSSESWTKSLAVYAQTDSFIFLASRPRDWSPNQGFR